MIKYIAEFIGTFFFVAIILNALKKNTGMASVPVAIGIGLIAAIILVGPISGAHLNPAVSLVTYLNNSMSQTDLMYYVLAQCAGALAAKQYFDKLN
jgi:aquaporin Z